MKLNQLPSKRFSSVVGVCIGEKRHGVASYNNGKLSGASVLSTPYLIDYVRHMYDGVISMENLMQIGSDVEITPSMAALRQAQIETVRWFDYYSIQHVVHIPQSPVWSIEEFERDTGWDKEGISHEVRSAAFFGYLAL